MGNSKTGGDDDIDAAGKYLLISVPEFAEDPITPGKLMTSYLRLGAASTTWRDDPGGKLAENINVSGPPGSFRNQAGGEQTGIQVDIAGDVGEARPIFIDDTRGRDGCPQPHGLEVAERLKQSQALHTRGGWRDHSDGNRITTTYGDKIEVIRGNYKMVILGRQDDPTSCSGWDTSGQHIQDFGQTMPGASVRVEWMQDRYTGAWHLENTTEGVVQSSNFAGDFYEYWWGDHHETTIGSEEPVWKLPAPDGRPRANPHIIEKTWAQKMESYTGSTAWRVPEIKEETWAEIITSLTDATSTTETTTVSGAITEATTAGSITETTSVDGEIKSDTKAGTIAENTESGAITSTTEAGAIVETTTAGTMTSVTVAGAIADVTVAGNLTELFVGTHVSTEIGLKLDLFIGGSITIDLGANLEVALPDCLQFSYPNKLQSTVDALKTSVNNLETAVYNNQVAAIHRITGALINVGIM